MKYCSLFNHNISSIVLKTSLRVVFLKFDNDVDNKSFEYHILTTRENIHSLVLLPNQSL